MTHLIAWLSIFAAMILAVGLGILITVSFVKPTRRLKNDQ